MTLVEQLRGVGLGVFPCNADKVPALPRGFDWRVAALTPIALLSWPTNVVGVPVPDNVVIIDLDTYKGVTRADVENVLSCRLDWDHALIQTTQRGGEHYAFKAPAWQVRQGSSLKIRGFDTRIGGKGYISTGEGYQWPDMWGLTRLSRPDLLPDIPDAARGVLEVLEKSEPTSSDLPQGDRAVDEILDALGHVEPECSRSDWLRVGLALRHQFHDDPEKGFSIFNNWSQGTLSTDQHVPTNYDGDSIYHQWESFKPEGATTIGTLFHMAIESGWTPPRTFDTAAAFGADATSNTDFVSAIENIQAYGADPRRTPELIEGIRGNERQRATLLALLTRELKDAGLLTAPVRKMLDTAAGHAKREGEYGANHTENVSVFLAQCYPQQAPVRIDQVWYEYGGRCWSEVSDDDMKHRLTDAMAPSYPQHNTVQGTYNVLQALCHVSGRHMNEGLENSVLFENGGLDIGTRQLSPHSPERYTTNILPYGYNPTAAAPRWARFLLEVFEGDVERICLLQEWFGYMISNSNVHHKIMLLLGPPRSGKGTIGRVLEQIVGTYNYTGASLHAFTSDAFLDSLRTKTVAFSGDTERRVNRNSIDVVIERLKKISGGDAVVFERKWKTTLTQTLPTRITLAANHVPALFDDSGALAGRLLILPFNVSYLGREDKYLFGSLCQELEGVAIWALDGLKRLISQGRFTEPKASRVEKEFIVESFSPLTAFVKEVCRIGIDSDVITTKDVYDAYRAWAVSKGEDSILGHRTFTKTFKDVTRGSGVTWGVYSIEGVNSRGFKRLRVDAVDSMAGAFTPRVVE